MSDPKPRDCAWRKSDGYFARGSLPNVFKCEFKSGIGGKSFNSRVNEHHTRALNGFAVEKLLSRDFPLCGGCSPQFKSQRRDKCGRDGSNKVGITVGDISPVTKVDGYDIFKEHRQGLGRF